MLFILALHCYTCLPAPEAAVAEETGGAIFRLQMILLESEFEC